MSLAHYCNLERSTVYKFINGKREPMSMELVEQIARFIQLTPPETYKFKEAWKMARMGENTYYIRKSMERFYPIFPINPLRLHIVLLSRKICQELLQPPQTVFC